MFRKLTNIIYTIITIANTLHNYAKLRVLFTIMLNFECTSQLCSTSSGQYRCLPLVVALTLFAVVCVVIIERVGVGDCIIISYYFNIYK